MLALAAAAVMAVFVREQVVEPVASDVAVHIRDSAQDERGAAAAGSATVPGSETGPATAEVDRERSVGGPVAVPALLEEGPYGPLPRIAAEGRRPRDVYAHPFEAGDDRSRIVIILAGLGLDDARTEAALRRLPPGVTLAFNAYADDLKAWAQKARAAGHEVLVTVPLDVQDFPYRDPGPRALLTTLTEAENIDRLLWTLSRMTGYVGAITLAGDRFLGDERAMEMLLSELGRRGLLYVNSVAGGDEALRRQGAEAGLPIAHVDLRIDDTPSRQAIDEALAELKTIARKRAIAIGLARPYPVTIDRLVPWLESLPDGFVLAPVSAVVDRRGRP